jgi:hypothetical protein
VATSILSKIQFREDAIIGNKIFVKVPGMKGGGYYRSLPKGSGGGGGSGEGGGGKKGGLAKKVLAATLVGGAVGAAGYGAGRALTSGGGGKKKKNQVEAVEGELLEPKGKGAQEYYTLSAKDLPQLMSDLVGENLSDEDWKQLMSDVSANNPGDRKLLTAAAESSKAKKGETKSKKKGRKKLSDVIRETASGEAPKTPPSKTRKKRTDALDAAKFVRVSGMVNGGYYEFG